MLAIFLLFFGSFLVHRIGFLNRNNVPPAVVGGLLCSTLVAVLGGFGVVDVSFDLTLRDLLLLVFFSTIGLNAKISSLLKGGKVLLLLVAVCSCFLIVQNLVGVAGAFLFGREPMLGLFGGSISLAGGHGTAIAWGKIATERGVEGAAEFGIACATLGIIAGGLLGGPLAGRLVASRGLQPRKEPDIHVDRGGGGKLPVPGNCLSIQDFMGTILALALCISIGNAVNQYLFARHITLPGFLTAMMVGVTITNVIEPFRIHLRHGAIEVLSGVSLQLFLTMSLASMNLLALQDSAFLLVIVMGVQLVLVVLYATRVVFRMMGADYDAAVITGGFLGLMLGATPVAMASMDAVSSRHGHSTKALLVVPLVGAFFIDLVNAGILTGFLHLPFF
ncbi:MAG: sodium/glutamate symporter [Planctomycetota bacterium]